MVYGNEVREAWAERGLAGRDELREAVRRTEDGVESTDSTLDSDARSEEENEENATHECRRCGYRCHISTPHIKTETWCQGSCDGFSMFVRLDKL